MPTLPLRNLLRRLPGFDVSFAEATLLIADRVKEIESVTLPDRDRAGEATPSTPMGIDCRWRCTVVARDGGMPLSGVTGNEDKLIDDRLRRIRGRSPLMLIASVCERSEGMVLFEDCEAGSAKLDVVGVVSSLKLVANARGVVGSGVGG